MTLYNTSQGITMTMSLVVGMYSNMMDGCVCLRTAAVEGHSYIQIPRAACRAWLCSFAVITPSASSSESSAN
jgi:hypothetical protein